MTEERITAMIDKRIEARDWWWGTICRAFGDPQVIGQARDGIRKSFVVGNQAFAGLDSWSVTNAVIDATLDLASAGELDRLVRIDPEEYLGASFDAEEALYARAHILGWPQVTDANTKMQLRTQTNDFLRRIVRAGQEGI